MTLFNQTLRQRYVENKGYAGLIGKGKLCIAKKADLYAGAKNSCELYKKKPPVFGSFFYLKKRSERSFIYPSVVSEG